MSSRQPGGASDSASAPDLEGFSHFVTRVLDQLSLSSWLPAALLVGATALISQIYMQKEVDLPAAVTALTVQPWGLLFVMIFALVATAMLLQAFELSAIRLLEGYWPSIASTLGITGAMVTLQMWRRDRALARIGRRRKRAFRAARELMLNAEEDIQLINFHKRVVDGDPLDDCPKHLEDAAESSPWEEYAEPQKLRAVEAAERSAENYPESPRIMPTKLGNALRAGEDKIRNNRNGPLRTFVIRNWNLIPRDIQELHDQYRNRLDLYCTLVFVCWSLGWLGGIALLSKESHRQFGALWLAGFITCAWVAYRAAVTSAAGYTGALQAIDTSIARRGQSAD